MRHKDLGLQKIGARHKVCKMYIWNGMYRQNSTDIAEPRSTTNTVEWVAFGCAQMKNGIVCQHSCEAYGSFARKDRTRLAGRLGST